MKAKIFKFFTRFTTLTLLPLTIACIVGLRYWKRLPEPFKRWVEYLWFLWAIEIGQRGAALLYYMNLPLLHLYTLGEFILLSHFYRSILGENSWLARYFKQVLIGGSVLIVANTVFLQGLYQFNPYAKTLVQILMILYALQYAYKFAAPGGAVSADEKELRLLNISVLMYHCGTLFLFMFSQLILRENDKVFLSLWNINVTLVIISQSLSLWVLWRIISKYRP